MGELNDRQAPELKRFHDAVGSRFRVVLDEGVPADLTLIEVAVRDRRPGWESFSLLFEGPSRPPRWDGLLQAEHPELGVFPLFLVAVLTESDGQHYEAVFNRRLP